MLDGIWAFVLDMPIRAIKMVNDALPLAPSFACDSHVIHSSLSITDSGSSLFENMATANRGTLSANQYVHHEQFQYGGTSLRWSPSSFQSHPKRISLCGSLFLLSCEFQLLLVHILDAFAFGGIPAYEGGTWLEKAQEGEAMMRTHSSISVSINLSCIFNSNFPIAEATTSGKRGHKAFAGFRG